jgi:hypothetical protein
MRRIVRFVGVLSALAAIATGCVVPALPSEYRPAAVSADVTPATVNAGESFTVSVTSIGAYPDKYLINDFDVRITAPQFVDPDRLMRPDRARWFTQVVHCDVPPFEPAQVIAVELVCPVPSFATNGHWLVEVIGLDGTGLSRAPFEWVTVAGGSDDADGPVLESVVVSPDPVVIGEPFTVTVQVSDDHPLHPYPTAINLPYPRPVGLSYGALGNGSDTCAESTYELLSSTVQQWQISCPANEDLTPGTLGATVAAGLHHPYTQFVEDAIGNRLTAEFSFDVVAP